MSIRKITAREIIQWAYGNPEVLASALADLLNMTGETTTFYRDSVLVDSTARAIRNQLSQPTQESIPQ